MEAKIRIQTGTPKGSKKTRAIRSALSGDFLHIFKPYLKRRRALSDEKASVDVAYRCLNMQSLHWRLHTQHSEALPEAQVAEDQHEFKMLWCTCDADHRLELSLRTCSVHLKVFT